MFKALICLFVLATCVRATCVAAEAKWGNSSRFKNGVAFGLTDIDQRELRGCSGAKFRLETSDGRRLTSSDYSDIEYCGHGLFLATDINPDNKYYFGAKRHFLNRFGNELAYRLPENTYLTNIFSFGDDADRDRDVLLERLPADSLLMFGCLNQNMSSWREPTLEGLCNSDGKILLSPYAGELHFLEQGRALINDLSNSPSSSFVVDLKTGQQEKTSLRYEPGRVPLERKPWPPFEETNIAKTLEDDGKFDHDYWCDMRNYPVHHLDMFNRFLHEYDLIGMDRYRLMELLTDGSDDNKKRYFVDGNTCTFEFPREGCVPHFFGVRVEFRENKVIAWCFSQGEYGYIDHRNLTHSHRTTTNVVLCRPQANQSSRIVTGRIGEQGNWRRTGLEQKPKVIGEW